MYIAIVTSFILFIDFAYFHLLLTRKRSIRGSTLIYIINYLIIIFGYYILSAFFEDSIFYRYSSTFLGVTVIIAIYLVFEESFSKKIFTMFTIWVFSHIILIISSYIISVFNIEDYNLYISYLILLRIFIQSAFLPIIYLYLRSPYKKMLKSISNNVINIISFYSITIFLFLSNYYKFYNEIRIELYSEFNSFLNVMIIILSYIVIFIAIWSINKNMELEYKFKIIDTQVELQKQNYKNLNKSIENYYALKHEIRHHVLAVKSMIDAKNYIAASEYIGKFTENEISENVDILCKNFTVDSILKYYMSITIKNDIEFKVNLNIPEDINIDKLDLSIVIGNCVKNAIEACDNIMDNRKKYIDIKAEIKGFQLIIKIKNSFNGQVIKDGKVIKTSKNGEGHGIGLSNIRNVTEKYNGYLNIKHDDKEFEVDIIMNYN
jgi:two-component system, LytTR family, sensor histidine kinase AgrC